MHVKELVGSETAELTKLINKYADFDHSSFSRVISLTDNGTAAQNGAVTIRDAFNDR